MAYDWLEVSIDQLGRIITGKTPKTALTENYGGSIPFLTPSDDMTVKHVETTNKHLTAKGLFEVKNCLLPPGSICVSCIGSDLGKVVMTTRETVTNQQINSIIPFNGVDADFVYYAMLKLGKELNYISKTSTAVPIVNKSSFSRFKIMLPILNEQKAISSLLSALDDKIENNRKINHRLEQTVQAIFKSWFVDFEPWGGVMPEDWRMVEFSTFLTPRIEKSSDSNIPLFSVTDQGIYPREQKFNKNLSKTSTKNKVAYKTDLIFGMSREILNWGVMRSPIGGISSAYNVFEVDRSINSKYLESFIKVHCHYFEDLIRPATREGQGIEKGILMQKSIYLPPDRILSEYYIIEDSLTEQIHEIEAESVRLTKLRDTLLPRLMSGELSVPDIENA